MQSAREGDPGRQLAPTSNADEWVREDYAAYAAAPAADPIGKVTEGEACTLRGGDFASYESFNDWVGVDCVVRRVALQDGPGTAGGFRCARRAN